MSKLKKFLDRRSENTGRKPLRTEEKTREEAVVIQQQFRKTFENLDLKEVYTEEENAQKEKDENLSDDDFWAILQDLQRQTKESEDRPIDILECLLEPFSDKQLEQFAEKYSNLNK